MRANIQVTRGDSLSNLQIYSGAVSCLGRAKRGGGESRRISESLSIQIDMKLKIYFAGLI